MGVQLLYALVDGKKTLPSKDINGKSLHGKCPLCGGEVFAKCGPYRVKHWAHKNKQDCETFTKDMSEWHKSWQEKFSLEWREEPIIDTDTKERHIADIRTSEGIVIEFQHSPIKPEEQLEREKFYSSHGGMVWVVDATCYQQVQKRFEEEKLYFEKINFPNQNHDLLLENYCVVNNAENIFPVQWVDRHAFVFFDYFDVEKNTGDKYLYCLFHKVGEEERIIWKCPRDFFVQFVSDSSMVEKYLVSVLQGYILQGYINYIRAIQQKNLPSEDKLVACSSYIERNRIYRARQFSDGIRKANERNGGGKSSGKYNGSKFRSRKWH